MNTLSENINRELKSINLWLLLNKIKVNVTKSKFIVFSYRIEPDFPTLQLGAGDISSTDQIKFLGVTLDKNLNFKPHINCVLNKMSKSVGVMYRLNNFLPSETHLSTFYSLVFAYLSYGVESWYSVAKTMSEKIQILKKKSIQSIFKIPNNDSTRTYSKGFNIRQLPDIYI